MSSAVEIYENYFCKKESTLQQELADAQSEWLFEVIYFLNPVDASNYGATCKHARHLICNQYLWSFYGTKFIACIQSPAREISYVAEAVSALKFPDPKSLYTCLHKAKRSLIGWHRIVPHVEENLSADQARFTRGGLVCLRREFETESSENIVLEIIEPSGKLVCKMSIIYIACQQKLICKLHDKGVFFLEFCESGIKLIAISRDMNYLIQPLPRNFQESKTNDYSRTRTPVINSVARIIGLFVARYGSHGLELLHVSLIENDERISDGVDAQQHTEQKGPFYVLNGLKVTGDPNVPAAQLSFTVDVTHPKNFYSWILSDSRPIILFTENGVVDATVMIDRQNNIQAAYRGKGQINREPDIWDPEWVDMTLVVYHNSSSARGASFSIVWDDVGETYRHLMDFSSFQGQNFPPIEPPLSWSSTTNFNYSTSEG